MKKILLTAIAVAILAFAAFAQSKDEKEVLKFLADYDAAYLTKDINVPERIWAKNYLVSTESGTKYDRAVALEGLKKDWSDPNPEWKLISYTTVNDWIHLSGVNAAVAGSYSTSMIPRDDPTATPHLDKGRYTILLEKQNGKWMVISEHFSEGNHDKKIMEADLIKASDSYTAAIKSKDRKMLERLLDDKYSVTDEDGSTRDKVSDINHMMRAGLTIDSAAVTDRKIRLLGNNAAIETGTYTAKGSNNGKPFEETGRFTTTWVSRNGQWQIAADQTTTIKNK